MSLLKISGMKRVVACGAALASFHADALLMTHEDTLEVETGDASEFDSYLQAFGRPYAAGSEEYNMRFALYRERVAHINAQNSRPGALWRAGVNHLTDRTDAEFSQLLGWRGINKGTNAGGGGFASLLETHAEFLDERVWDKTVDYRNLSMAYKVPEQSSCGSCWAVATTTMLEAHSELHLGNKRSFSSQQLVNCVPNPKECGGQGGCRGATVELGMDYVQKMGLLQEEKIPYKAEDQTCEQPIEPCDGKTENDNPSNPGNPMGGSLLDDNAFRSQPGGGRYHGGLQSTRGGGSIGLQAWKTLPENKVTPLVNALLQGPVAISVGADGWSSYEAGVFDGCGKDAVINHAVNLFGMGKEKGQKYWLVRNSWGTGWGEKGFIRLLRQDTAAKEEADHCGTDHDPAKGIACKPYPDSVKVCGMCGILYDSVAVQMGHNGKISAKKL